MDSGCIAFDESHGQAWTISLETATQRNSDVPEYHYYGHLTEIARKHFPLRSVRLCEPWTTGSFSGVNALVLAHSVDKNGISPARNTPQFSQEDIELLVRYVADGGGLLIIGEWHSPECHSNINELLTRFGLSYDPKVLQGPPDRERSYLVEEQFLCSTVEPHELTRSVSSISYHGGCSINIEAASARSLIRAPFGECVVAAAELGRGRVVVVGDSDMFASPFIGKADNSVLFINILDWITKLGFWNEATTPKLRQSMQRIVTGSKPVPAFTDLAQEEGEHALDCQQYRGALEDFCYRPLPDPYQEREAFLEHAELIFHKMPADVRRRIIRFRRWGNQHGALLLRSLPVDPSLPPTPADANRPQAKRSFVSELWLAVLGTALGEPVSYAQQKQGELYQNVCPTRKDESMLSSDSSKILLDFHTESAFHTFMPDYLLLYCLRQDRERKAKTIVASVANIVPLLPLRYRSVLSETPIKTGIDHSFGSPNMQRGNGPNVSVLYGNPYDPFLRYDGDLMEPATQEVKDALAEVTHAIERSKCFVCLQPGDLLVVDNRRAVHGRTSFVAKYDGQDRWLQRMYVVRELATSADSRALGDRVINTKFRT